MSAGLEGQQHSLDVIFNAIAWKIGQSSWTPNTLRLSATALDDVTSLENRLEVEQSVVTRKWFHQDAF